MIIINYNNYHGIGKCKAITIPSTDEKILLYYVKTTAIILYTCIVYNIIICYPVYYHAHLIYNYDM